MYYFLGIVRKDDFDEGVIYPTYTLRIKGNNKENCTGFIVVNENIIYDSRMVTSRPKVLVTDITSKEAGILVDYLSHYRRREFSKRTKKRQSETVHGALFWFACNIHGKPLGPAIFIKRIPDREHLREGGYQEYLQYLEAAEQSKDITKVLSEDSKTQMLEYSNVKAKLHQNGQ